MNKYRIKEITRMGIPYFKIQKRTMFIWTKYSKYSIYADDVYSSWASAKCILDMIIQKEKMSYE